MAMSKPNNIIDDSFNMEAEEEVELEIANYTDEYEILDPDLKKEIDHQITTMPTGTIITPVDFTIKYAPQKPAVKGVLQICVIPLKWKDNNGVSPSRARGMARNVSNIYGDLSNGNMKLVMTTFPVHVNLEHRAGNVPAAEREAKRKADAAKRTPGKYDIYIIINNGAKKVSNASGNTVHLYGALIRDGLHELGHLRPFGLMHSGKVLPNGKVDGYGDGTSFMSRLASQKLTASQLYALGWTEQNQVAQHDIGDPEQTYNIQNIGIKNGDDLRAVLIPGDGSSDLFLSVVTVQGKSILALHKPYGARGTGSTRVALFANDKEYNNLLFRTISTDGEGHYTVSISPQPEEASNDDEAKKSSGMGPTP